MELGHCICSNEHTLVALLAARSAAAEEVKPSLEPVTTSCTCDRGLPVIAGLRTRALAEPFAEGQRVLQALAILLKPHSQVGITEKQAKRSGN